MTMSPHVERRLVAPEYPAQRVAADYPPARPLVFVSVGTDHHPFDRLVGWVDAWSQSRPDIEVVIQHGEALRPEHAEAMPYLSHQELVGFISRASVVISHGGPATIAEAWKAGLVPIVAPRAHELGEHVDNHQQAFAAVLGAREQVVKVATESELITALNRALAEPTWLRKELSRDSDVDASIARFASVVDELTHKHRHRSRSAT